jgi:hypothetical protein
LLPKGTQPRTLTQDVLRCGWGREDSALTPHPCGTVREDDLLPMATIFLHPMKDPLLKNIHCVIFFYLPLHQVCVCVCVCVFRECRKERIFQPCGAK